MTGRPARNGAALALLIAFGCAGSPQEQPRSVVRVAGIVLKWVRADKEANWRRAEPMIRRAAAGGAELVVTTECFLDGYAIDDKSIPLETYRALGEAVPEGPYYRKIAALADELDIYLVAGLLEADGEARYNTAVVIGPDGRLIGKYRKLFLEHESVRNTPGNSCPVFDTPWGRMGIVICADRRVPKIMQRVRRNGADFVVIPSGGIFGWAANDPIVQARSRDNGVPIAFVHPVEFMVTDQNGEIQARSLLGERLNVTHEEIGGPRDLNEVFFQEMEIPRRPPARAGAP